MAPSLPLFLLQSRVPDRHLILNKMPQEEFEEYVRDDNIGAWARHDKPIDRIGLPDRLPSLLRPKWTIAGHMTILAAESLTTQQPESRLQALQVTNNG